MKRLKLFSVFVIVFLNCLCLYGQNETGTRYINQAGFKSWGYWYDSTTAVFQEQFPIIRSIPPLSTSMPINILFSYIYLDSLLRFGPSTQVEKRISKWTAINDTMTSMMSVLYMMKDYNPIIFNQYMDEVGLNGKSYYNVGMGIRDTLNNSNTSLIPPPSNPPTGKYTNSLTSVVNKLLSRWFALSPNKNEELAIYSLIKSDYILRVRVLSIDSALNKNSPLHYNRYRVTAEVLDTIKGKVFHTLPQYSAKKKTILENFPIMQFGYTPLIYPEFTEWSSGSVWFDKRDEAFTGLNGEFTMKSGQEAVVFIVFHNGKVDYQNDYYDISLDASCSNAALPIIDNQVRDNNHVWSPTSLDYDAFKNRLFELINKIMTGKF